MIEIPSYNKNIRVVMICVGNIGSGKTHYAKQLVASEPNRWKRINRDDLRWMLHGDAHDYTSKAHEDAVTRASDALVTDALNEGFDVVLDNTHLDAKSRKAVHLTVQSLGKDSTVIEKVFTTPIDLCLERNSQRTGKACVPEEIILKKVKQFHFRPDGTSKLLKDSVTEYSAPVIGRLEQNPDLPTAIMCDLDGTLCLMNGRNPFDTAKCDEDLPNPAVIDLVGQLLHQTETHVIFMSGRSDKFRDLSKHWINKHLYTDDEMYSLFMRAEGDMRADYIVKRELFQKNVQGNYFIRFALDDRGSVVQEWRRLGLPCFQVAPGNF